MQGLAIRAVLGLGDRAGCRERGGVRGREGGLIKATSWMAREIMTSYQMLEVFINLTDFDCKCGV